MFTRPIVAEYAMMVASRFRKEGFAPGYRLRMDMTRSGIQTQEAVGAFARCFADFPKASRIAIITASPLLRMQVRRVMTQPYLCVFDTADEGLAWLLEEPAVCA